MPVGKSTIVYDHYQYQWEKRLVVFFLFFGTLLGVGSFISDVFNYLEFASYESQNNSGLIGLHDMVTTFFAFIIIAGIIYGVELIFMLVAFGGMWPRSSNGRQAIMWTREFFSIIDSILCDVSFLVLYYLSFGVGFCPMLRQMRTLRGKIAVAMTAVHAVFAIVQSVYYRKVVGRYPSNCERLLKKFCWVLHTLVASFAVFVLVAAYINYPIHSAMTRNQFRQWGFGEMQTAPVYFVQDVNVADVIQKQFNATGVNLSSKNRTSSDFDSRLNRILQCKGLRTGFYFSDLKDILDAENGLLKSFNCSDVLPSFEFILEDQHKPILNQANCTIHAKVKYDFQTSLITYAVGYELRPVNTPNECYEGYFNMAEPETANVAPYKIQLSPDSTSHINKAIMGDTCSLLGCHGNITGAVENFFSCIDRQCFRYNTTGEISIVKASAFRIAWNVPTMTYQSDLKSLRSLVQCHVGVKVDSTDLKLCQNNTIKYSVGKKFAERCF